MLSPHHNLRHRVVSLPALVKFSKNFHRTLCNVPLPDHYTDHNMRYFPGLFLAVFVVITVAEDPIPLLDNLFSEIKSVLNAEESYTRQHQQYYRPQNNGISLGVYEALRSIARNDELECISRLLCEAAAGGQPGYTGKEIKFDKVSLMKLMSYLKLDTGSSSPLLVFGKAALLGVSNRGDPYSCIINYPKCPKDQSRLLYYLNNHRGGFFQYFDKQHYNHYRPSYQYSYKKHQNRFNRNKIQFEKPGGLYEKLKKKATNDIYATKYTHSSLTFPGQNYNRNKPMVFPENEGLPDPRILSKPVRAPLENSFFFSSSNRHPKKLNGGFFPKNDEEKRLEAAVATDRLPSRLIFSDGDGSYPYRYPANSFFPSS